MKRHRINSTRIQTPRLRAPVHPPAANGRRLDHGRVGPEDHRIQQVFGGPAGERRGVQVNDKEAPRAGRRTLAADKGYDQRSLITGLRTLGWTPHIARGPTSSLDGRTTRHASYATSQRHRKRVEESFGWGKTVGLLRKLRHRGRELVDWIFTFIMAAYNLVRLRTLIGAGGRP
jgi:IS5 family transposase